MDSFNPNPVPSKMRPPSSYLACSLRNPEDSGTTQREGMGREEGGGFRMGNTCIPVADSF